jgi:hypothetical protein
MNLEKPQLNKKESKNNLEKLRDLAKKATRLTNTALKILVIGGLSLMAEKAYTQDNKSSQNFEKSESKIEWQAELSEEEKAEVEERITYQKEWLKSYLNSPKFEERLAKEIIRSKKLLGENYYMSYEEFLENPDFKAFEVNESGDTIKIINFLDKTIAYEPSQYQEISEEDFTSMMEAGGKLERLLPDPNIAEMEKEEKEKILSKVNDIKEIRLILLDEGPVIVTDSIPNEENDGIIDGQYQPFGRSVSLRKDFTERSPTAAIHEFAHRSTDGKSLLNRASMHLLRSKAGSWSEYLNDPTEIHARINELRFLMSEEGLYDPGNENFQEKHFLKMLENKKIMKCYPIRQLIDTLSRDNLIWFMNNMADGSVSAISTGNIA